MKSKQAACFRNKTKTLVADLLAGKASLYLSVLLCLIGCSACANSDVTQSTTKRYTTEGIKDMRDVTHRNGLTLKLPATLTARETFDGFVVESADNSNAQTRRPTEVEIEKRQANDFTVSPDAKEKSVSKRTINYVVEESEGGSGGREYELIAWENVAGGFIVYRQRQQAEHSTPEFEMCWTVIENTSLK